MVLSGCVPMRDSSEPAAASTNTFTISFTGIQAVELTVNLIGDMSVSAIVRLENEPVPVWTDIKDKVGLLTRNIVAGTPKRIFTAKHYGTNDSLKTNIGAMSAADILQPETAYKIYVFHNESVIEMLSFTTAAIPPASEFTPTRTGYSMKFAPNVLPFNAEIIYNRDGERKGTYEVYGKEGEVLLIPLYMDAGRPLKTGWYFFPGSQVLTIGCAFNTCLPDAGYGVITPEDIYSSIVPQRYYKILFGIESFNTKTVKDAGYGDVKDGADGEPYIIHFITDQ
ncbi:hypothetical protein P0082_09000 [Candidatus Haliotispira prima]|uniref:Lipoprotein n=1 Tax=Candidatus Haliotispira prima TaxID=3034016 RepID=A0ABY8MF60_9SPIO|nr:hypothetical protein P0082_09000 [Candidatus Haliotispira prima]